MNTGIYFLTDDDHLGDYALCWQVIVPKKGFLSEQFEMIDWCKAAYGTHWGGDWNWEDSACDYRFRYQEDALLFYLAWAQDP